MSRLSFDDVLDSYYKKNLPLDILRIVEMAYEESNDTFFLPLIKDYDNALKVLEYSNNKEDDLNELAVINSDVLSSVKGTIDFYQKEIEWLGYDLFPFGGTSLILDGFFFKPDLFNKWVGELNKNGLFSQTDKMQEYIEEYLVYAKDNIVENYNLTELNFDAVRVGRVK